MSLALFAACSEPQGRFNVPLDSLLTETDIPAPLSGKKTIAVA